jgi:hypothetical protein
MPSIREADEQLLRNVLLVDTGDVVGVVDKLDMRPWQSLS